MKVVDLLRVLLPDPGIETMRRVASVFAAHREPWWAWTVYLAAAIAYSQYNKVN